MTTLKTKLSVNEAAEYLGVTRLRINALLHKGVLTAEGNQVDTRKKMIPLHQLEALKHKNNIIVEEAGGAGDERQLTALLIERLEAILAETKAAQDGRPSISLHQTLAHLNRLIAEMLTRYESLGLSLDGNLAATRPESEKE